MEDGKIVPFMIHTSTCNMQSGTTQNTAVFSKPFWSQNPHDWEKLWWNPA